MKRRACVKVTGRGLLSASPPAAAGAGEHAAGDGDLGDLAPTPLGDLLEGGALRAAAGCCFLRCVDQRPADVWRALLGDVAEPCVAVGGADGRSRRLP
jgi:hypothetical protein